MRWRAMYGPGGEKPPDPAPVDPFDPSPPAVPGLNNSKQYITLVSRMTGIEYKCGLMYVRKQPTVLLPTLSGVPEYRNELRQLTLFGYDFNLGWFNWSPPFHGSGDTPEAELKPPLYDSGYPADVWANEGVAYQGKILTPDEFRALTCTLNWDDIMAGGTSLYDIYIADAYAYISSGAEWRLYSEKEFFFDIKEGGGYIEVEPFLNTINQTEYPDIYSAYCTRPGLVELITPTGVKQNSMYSSVWYSLFNKYNQNAYVHRREWQADPSISRSTYIPDYSGFQQYGDPHAYIVTCGDMIGICTNAENYLGDSSYNSATVWSWPNGEWFGGTIEDFGITPVDNPDYKPGGGGNNVRQYRVPGWANCVLRRKQST